MEVNVSKHAVHPSPFSQQRIIAGVCGGLADFRDHRSGSAWPSCSPPHPRECRGLIYLIMWIIVPLNDWFTSAQEQAAFRLLFLFLLLAISMRFPRAGWE
jgi:hypothetical protein